MKELQRYEASGAEFVWVQEGTTLLIFALVCISTSSLLCHLEPKNMGAWTFMYFNFRTCLKSMGMKVPLLSLSWLPSSSLADFFGLRARNFLILVARRAPRPPLDRQLNTRRKLRDLWSKFSLIKIFVHTKSKFSFNNKSSLCSAASSLPLSPGRSLRGQLLVCARTQVLLMVLWALSLSLKASNLPQTMNHSVEVLRAGVRVSAMSRHLAAVVVALARTPCVSPQALSALALNVGWSGQDRGAPRAGCCGVMAGAGRNPALLSLSPWRLPRLAHVLR